MDMTVMETERANVRVAKDGPGSQGFVREGRAHAPQRTRHVRSSAG